MCCRLLLLQPVIVMATCHAAEEGTPASLFQFFAGPSLAAGAGQQHQEMNGHQHQHSHQQQGAQPCAALEAEPHSNAAAVAAPCIVRMQRPSEGAWRQAAASGADYVAAAAAAHAALLLRQGLSAAIVAASEQGQQAVTDQPPAACSVQQQQQQQQQQPQQQPAAAAEGDALAAAPCLQPCNAAELQQGLRLFSQLLNFQRKLADMLDKDEERLDELASWTAQAGAGRRRGGGGDGGQCPLTFTAIADQCRTGAYDSVDEVQAAAAAAAAVVLAAAQEVRQRARQEQRRRVRPLAPDECVELAPDAVTAACAVQDEIDCACHDLRQQLYLGEERNVDLLAAGAAQVRQLQRTETARRLAAAAEAAATGAAAADVAAVNWAQQQAQQPGPQEEQAEEQHERDVQHPRQRQEAKEPDVELLESAGAGAGAAAGAASQSQQQGQHQQQQLPAAAATALLQQKVIATAAQLLRRHLWDMLRPAVHLHLPAAPPGHGSVWLALQESLGRLGRVAMAACGSVLGSLATMEGVEGLEAACDAGGEPASVLALFETLMGAIAARCLAAFEAGCMQLQLPVPEA
jgi:hypothetical protein